MPHFVVIYAHPDEEGWATHVGAHVDWLVHEVDSRRLKASGPFVGRAVGSAMLIFEAEDRSAVDAIIATDPFWAEGVIEDMTVTEWDPIFGVFAKGD